jgi:hypothetical protein
MSKLLEGGVRSDLRDALRQQVPRAATRLDELGQIRDGRAQLRGCPVGRDANTAPG